MSELVTKKITLEDIIARKDEIRDSKNKTIKLYVKSFDGYVVAQMPDRKLIADSAACDTEIESNVHLVYNCIVEPDLRDKEAQKAFGVYTPKELLQTIFNDGEISFMAKTIIEVAGFKEGNVRLVDDIKN